METSSPKQALGENKSGCPSWCAEHSVDIDTGLLRHFPKREVPWFQFGGRASHLAWRVSEALEGASAWWRAASDGGVRVGRQLTLVTARGLALYVDRATNADGERYREHWDASQVGSGADNVVTINRASR